jgi:hypothetical protein
VVHEDCLEGLTEMRQGAETNPDARARCRRHAERQELLSNLPARLSDAVVVLIFVLGDWLGPFVGV